MSNAARKDASEDELEDAASVPAQIAETREQLTASIADADARRAAAAEALARTCRGPIKSMSISRTIAVSVTRLVR